MFVRILDMKPTDVRRRNRVKTIKIFKNRSSTVIEKLKNKKIGFALSQVKLVFRVDRRVSKLGDRFNKMIIVKLNKVLIMLYFQVHNEVTAFVDTDNGSPLSLL